MRCLCSNPWCKSYFIYDGDGEAPSICYKCKSFDSELSDGVSWSEKKYEGEKNDGMCHPISLNINFSNDKKW
jgi:hypothetical protein